MIIRSNLASAPIKNYSLFLLACIFLGIGVVAFTAWNLASLSGSYLKNSALKNTIAIQEKQLQELESKANAVQTKIGNIKTKEFISETEFMNNAIKRRTFSWTALFDHFEEVLPPTVKMISVIPSVSEENIAINLEMAGQSLTDMLELVRLLERDPAFSNVVLKGERTENDQQIQFSVSLIYIPLKKEANEKGESL
jgi:cell division protein FtsB